MCSNTRYTSFLLPISWLALFVTSLGVIKTVQFVGAPRDVDASNARTQATAWCEQFNFEHDTNHSMCEKLEFSMLLRDGTSGCVEVCLHMYNSTVLILRCNDNCVRVWSNFYDISDRVVGEDQRLMYVLFIIIGGSVISFVALYFLINSKLCMNQTNPQRPPVQHSDDTPRLDLHTPQLHLQTL